VSYFHEEQRFARSWAWLLVVIFILGAVGLALAVTASPAMTPLATAVAAITVLAVLAVLSIARLETDVNADEVVIAFRGIWPTRRVKLADIVAHEARRYSLLESGGWGVHWGLAGMTYNVSGDRGVHLRLRDGKRVLIGSRRADELDAAIGKALTMRSVTGDRLP